MNYDAVKSTMKALTEKIGVHRSLQASINETGHQEGQQLQFRPQPVMEKKIHIMYYTY